MTIKIRTPAHCNAIQHYSSEINTTFIKISNHRRARIQDSLNIYSTLTTEQTQSADGDAAMKSKAPEQASVLNLFCQPCL